MISNSTDHRGQSTSLLIHPRTLFKFSPLNLKLKNIEVQNFQLDAMLDYFKNKIPQESYDIVSWLYVSSKMQQPIEPYSAGPYWEFSYENDVISLKNPPSCIRHSWFQDVQKTLQYLQNSFLSRKTKTKGEKL